MRWGEKVTFDFVKIYLKHECLWNPTHPGYRLKNQREKAYYEISNEFKAVTMKSLSVIEVKLKIKNLRTTYMQQVHKILEKSKPDSIYEPSLFWFQEMDKCLKHISTNRNFVSYGHNQENPEVDSSSQIWVDLPGGSTDEAQPDPLVTAIENSEEDDMQKPRKLKREIVSSPSHHKKIKKKKSKRRSLEYSTDSNSDITKEVGSSSSAKEDEFDIYGKYIASQLRKMDLKKALRLQLEFQTLVSEARISDIVSD